MTTTTNPSIPSDQRPVRLWGRSDLKVRMLDFCDGTDCVVKDPIALTYFRLLPEQFRLLELLDGQRSLSDMHDCLAKEFKSSVITGSDVRRLIAELHQKGLVVARRPDQGQSVLEHAAKQRRQKCAAMFRQILFIRLPGWDPNRVLNMLYPRMNWMFARWAVIGALLFILSSWLLLLVQFAEYQRQLPLFSEFFAWPNLLYLWLTVGVAKLIHELAHGLACRHFGAECHEIGVAFLIFSPCMYCDVSDAWLLTSKRKRILISSAGIYVEVLMSACAISLWWLTQDGLLHFLLLNLFLVTTLTTVIFNANPLLRYDGYYVLSDWVEVSNLRQKADAELWHRFASVCLGINRRRTPFMPESRPGWFLLFSLAAFAYRWLVLATITIFLYTFLKPYGLQTLAWVFLGLSLVGTLYRFCRQMTKIVSNREEQPMPFLRISAWTAALAAALVLAMTIPLPIHGSAPLVIEPHQVVHVYARSDGRLANVLVTPGINVTYGQPLIQLIDLETESGVITLSHERRKRALDVTLYRSLGDSSGQVLAGKSLDLVDHELLQLNDQSRRLVIRAPCAGAVMAPRVQQPSHDATSMRHAAINPIEQRNRGAYVSPGTHVCSLAPNDRWQATLYIDQALRDEVRVGQEVKVMLDSRPGLILSGRLQQLAVQDDRVVPHLLSSKYGGGLPTVTDAESGEAATAAIYHAVVLLETQDVSLTNGMRGQARLLIHRPTLMQWVSEFISHTVHFRL
ncbi:MAG: HlyD family efflux transporter periplasmic adaptor subunit [Planctomycetaceae bacterium]